MDELTARLRALSVRPVHLGKLMIMDLRERASRDWEAGFSLRRLHAAMLDLGSPPLGLLGTAVERGYAGAAAAGRLQPPEPTVRL